MSARTAAKQIAKVLPFNLRLPKEPIIDLAFTSRCSKVEIRVGSLDDGVAASIELCIEDGRPYASIDWTLERSKFVNGERKTYEPDPAPHGGLEFGLDEIEAFATALYQAVQLAKKQGYLPAVTGGEQS